MRRATLSLILMAGLVAAAGSASAGGLDVRIGGFMPRGDDTFDPRDSGGPVYLFGDLNDLYTPNADPNQGVRTKDFRGVFGGIEFNTVVAPYVELGVSVDGYGRTVDSSYRDYAREDGREIEQRLKLSMVPIGFTVRVMPTGKQAALAPYLGVGIDAIVYSYEEEGDFIDFFDPELPIVPDAFRDRGAMFGAHVVGGLRVYLNRDFAIVGEGRYQRAKKDMSEDEDFSNYRLDLSGASFTVGLHVRF